MKQISMIVASSYPPLDLFDFGCPFWTALHVESGFSCSLLMNFTIVSSFQNRRKIFHIIITIQDSEFALNSHNF